MDLTKLRRWRQRQRQKAIGLVSKTTTVQVHHAFSFISFRSLHNYDQILSFFGGRERQGDSFYHLCLNSAWPPLFSSNLNSLLWKDAESIVQRRFYGRRRCRIVRSLIVYNSDNNENVITARRLLSKQQVCRCITLFFTFLCRCCKNTTGNCLILRVMEDVNKWRRNFLSLPKLECGPQENEWQGNSPTFYIFSELEQTRQSLKNANSF